MDAKLDEFKKGLLDEERQIDTLNEVMKHGQSNPRICQRLWESDELIFTLLQYFTNSFYVLNTELFTEEEANKVKCCLDTLTTISKHVKISDQFFKLQFDYFVYPFLMSTASCSLRTSALALFYSLLHEGIPERMKSSELLPLLLKTIDSEDVDCQPLALETLELILVGSGLDYAVQTIDRFQAIDVVINSFLKKSIAGRNAAILPVLLRIYIRLCDKANVRMKLREKLPEVLESKDMMELCAKSSVLSDLRSRLLCILA